MDPDATYKSILSHTIMVEELMHWLVADWHGMHALVDALDFSTLTRMHEQSVSAAGAALRRHSNDMVWRVHLRGRGEDDAPASSGRTGPTASPPGGDGGEPEACGPWLYLVVMLEFQSTVDYLMPLRIRNYVDGFHMEQWRGRRFRATDRLAPVLPIVLYIGKPRWTAAARVIDLVTPQAAQAETEERSTPWRVDPRFAGDGYVLWEEERRAEGRETGRAEGRVMGQRESMWRQAAMKFDAETAARLGAVLEGVTDQEVFDGVLAALLECDTPSDLLERATEVRRRTNGRNPPADC